MKIPAFLALALLASGCEIILGIEDASDGTGPGGIDPPADAGATPGDVDAGPDIERSNSLGLLCGPDFRENGFDGLCPGDGVCIVEFADWFDPDLVNGVCSFSCTSDDPATCMDGYQGPPEGEPVCLPASEGARGVAAGMCGIQCEGGDSNLGCPPEMPCLPFTDPQLGFLGSGCGGPTWVQNGPDV